jgi:16S rRNA (cytidine1402-2'-O)-methyltransferase
MAGTLLLVATPIGNLEDITLRALRVLREADLIAAEDTRRTSKLLAHYGITTKTISLHEHNERRKAADLVDRARAGATIAVVSDAGMPLVSDPGRELLREALTAGVRIEIVPGASALTTAMAGSTIWAEITSFAGFPPSRTGERRRWLADLARLPGALIAFEAPHRLRQTLQDILDVLGNREVVVAHELTKVHESWHRGHVSELLDTQNLPERGEFTLVIGPPAAAERALQSELPDTDTIGYEFGRLTKNDGRTRKEAIAELAGKYRLPKRQIYAMVEASKILVNDQID